MIIIFLRLRVVPRSLLIWLFCNTSTYFSCPVNFSLQGSCMPSPSPNIINCFAFTVIIRSQKVFFVLLFCLVIFKRSLLLVLNAPQLYREEEHTQRIYRQYLLVRSFLLIRQPLSSIHICRHDIPKHSRMFICLGCLTRTRERERVEQTNELR